MRKFDIKEDRITTITMESEIGEPQPIAILERVGDKYVLTDLILDIAAEEDIKHIYQIMHQKNSELADMKDHEELQQGIV